MSVNGWFIPNRKIFLEMGSVSTISKLTSDIRLAKNNHAFEGTGTLIRRKCSIIYSLFIALKSLFSDCEMSSFRIKFNTMIDFEVYVTVFATSATFLAISSEIYVLIDLVAIVLSGAIILPSSDLKY